MIGQVRLVWSEIGDSTGELSKVELAQLTRAVPKRLREFAAGRQLAKRLLADLGVVAESIPIGEDRYPDWPCDFTGSISHSSTHAIAVVCASSDHRSIGVDIELINSVDVDLFESLFDDREQNDITSSGNTNKSTVLFSCKEAVFKSVYPIHREFLDYKEVRITEDGRQFRAKCLTNRESCRSIERGQGVIFEIPGHVATLFVVD